MVFNDNFNNISAISWRSVLLVEETGEPGEKQRPIACHWQGLLFSVHFVHITCSRHEIHVAEKLLIWR